MGREKRIISAPSYTLASRFRGLYCRVARRLDVDPSYVSRVARGERQSEAIEAALEREMRQIMKMVKTNLDGFGRHAASHDGSNHNGASQRSAKKTRTAK